MTWRRDRGGVLPITLVFVTVFALVLIAVASLTTANLRATSVTKDRTDSLYTRDGGIEAGINELSADWARCDAATTLGPYTLNGADVTVDCVTVSGGSSGGGGNDPFFTITGDRNVFLDKDPAAEFGDLLYIEGNKGDEVRINSKAHVAGGIEIEGGDPPLVFSNGLSQPSPFCTQGVPGLQTPGGRTCSSTYLDPDPTPWAPTSNARSRRNHSGCRIYFPGRYTSSFQVDSDSYFASGVYYFDNIGEIQFSDASVTAGEPGAGATSQLNPGNEACATDADAMTYSNNRVSGKGVVFVLGGNSRLKLASSSSNTLEMFAREPGAPGEPADWAGLSVLAHDRSGGGLAVWREEEPLVTDSFEGTLVIQGMLYAPQAFMQYEGRVNTNASSDADKGFSFGGIVVSYLNVKMTDGSGTTKLASGPVDIPLPRTVVLTATVDSRTTTAVVYEESPPRIESWNAE